jgi:hypothetical protein
MPDMLNLCYIPNYVSTIHSFAATLLKARRLPGFARLVSAAEFTVRNVPNASAEFDVAFYMFTECHGFDEADKWNLYDGVRLIATLNVVNATLDDSIEEVEREQYEAALNY